MNRWTSLFLAIGGLTAFPLVDSDNSKVTQIIQSFEDAKTKVEGDLCPKLQEEARKKVVKEIRSRSRVEISEEFE